VTPDTIPDWAAQHEIAQIVTSYIPTGPTRDALQHVPLCQVMRPYDRAAWPHATHGFFRFKDRIPHLLGEIKGLQLQ
jgi:deoxyribodipyrimidine photo-lyase